MIVLLYPTENDIERSDIPPREIEIELIFPTMGVDIRMEGAKCCSEEANHLEMLL